MVRGGIVYRNDRIVIPVALRKRLIAKLHQGHMGTESTLRRARTSLWPWSKVGSNIFERRRERYLVLVDYYSDWIEFDLIILCLN